MLHSTIPLSASYTRVAFTTLFVVLNFAISFLGARLIRRRVQRHLTLQKRDSDRKVSAVPINHLTPWLAIIDFSTYVLRIRKLPGGIYGILMFWTAIFSVAHQYFVSAFINSTDYPSICNYTKGVNTLSLNSDTPFEPASEWPATNLVSTALAWAAYNGGEVGIYAKVPPMDVIVYFRPRKSDVLGAWNCIQKNSTTISRLDLESKTAAMSAINKVNFLYPQIKDIAAAFWPGKNSLQDFVYWSANAYSEETKQWDVRASMVNGLDQPNNSQSLLASNFECSSAPITSQKWTPPLMPSSVIANWSQYLHGKLLLSNSSSYNLTFAQTLDTMSMVAGSENSWGQQIIPGQDSHYGCLSYGAAISSVVYIMLFVLVAMFLAVLVIYLYGSATYKFGYMQSGDELSYVPTDLLSWQLAMIKQSTGNEDLRMSQLKNVSYAYRWNDGGTGQVLTFADDNYSYRQSAPNFLNLPYGETEYLQPR